MSYEATPALTKKQNIMQGIKFALFSCSAGLIQIAAFTFFKEVLQTRDWIAYTVGLVLSVLYNFTVNRKFTFKSATNVPVAMLKVAAYYAVFAPLSIWAEKYFTEDVGVNGYLVTALIMLTNLVTEFLFCRLFVYRNSMYTNDLGRKELEHNAAHCNCDCGHMHEDDPECGS